MVCSVFHVCIFPLITLLTSLTHTHTLSLSLTHTHTLSLTHTHTLSLSLTHTLSLSLTHTHTPSLTHTGSFWEGELRNEESKALLAAEQRDLMADLR
jgi:hypothetical protein